MNENTKNPTIPETLAYMREEKVKHTKPYQAHYDNVIEGIENQPRWIPVSERLPTKNSEDDIVKQFLVTLRTEDGRVRRDIAWYWFDEPDVGWNCNDHFPFATVLAWQPLPKAFESEDNEND